MYSRVWQLILEQARSKNQIDKVLDYIHTRQRKYKSSTKPKNFKDHVFHYLKRSKAIAQPAGSYPHSQAQGGRLLRPDRYTHEIKHIPVKSIIRTQSYVDKANVRHLAHAMNSGDFDETRSPLHVIHDPKTGKHTVVNGHHRLFGALLNRRKTILAKVSTLKSDKEQEVKESLTVAALIAAKVAAGGGALWYARRLVKKMGLQKKRDGRKMNFKGLSKHVRGILADNPDTKPIRGIGRGPASKRSQIAVFAGKKHQKNQGRVTKEDWEKHREKIPKRPWQFLKQQVGPGHLRTKRGDHTFEHTQGDTKVLMTGTKKGNYDVSYEGNFGSALVNHLHSKADEFVQEHKPRSVNFASHKKPNQMAHAEIAHSLAKKHNGKVSQPDEFTHRVEF